MKKLKLLLLLANLAQLITTLEFDKFSDIHIVRPLLNYDNNSNHNYSQTNSTLTPPIEQQQQQQQQQYSPPLAGLTKLCIENEPDGFSILENSFGKEIFFLFKDDSYWMKPVDELYDSIFDNEKLILDKTFNKLNQLSLFNKWNVNIQPSPKYILSFYGLNKIDQFYNNVLVFKDSNLFRYKVNFLNNNNNELNVSLLSETSVKYWQKFILNSISLMLFERESRVLITRDKGVSIINPAYSAYVLNKNNLISPIHYDAFNLEILNKNINKNMKSLKFFYELKNKTQLFFDHQTRELCFNNNCQLLHNIVECDQSIGEFIRSFAYFLWQDTDLTFRLMLVGLSSIMVVNLTLAISFIYHQIDRFTDLT